MAKHPGKAKKAGAASSSATNASWRHANLASKSVDQLAEWLREHAYFTHEALAHDVDRNDRLAYFEVGGKAVDSLDSLADFAGSSVGIRTLILGLDATATHLLRSLVWSRSETFERLDLDAAPATHGLTALRDALLLVPDGNTHSNVRLPHDVRAILALPGISMRDIDSSTTSDYFAAALQGNNVTTIPTRRDERIQALLDVLTNEHRIREIISALSDSARVAFVRLVESVAPMSTHSVGLHLSQTMQREHRKYYARPEHAAAHELYDLGLIGINSYEHSVWVWREVVQTVRPILSPPLAVVPRPKPVTVTAENRLAYPVSTLERLFDAWRAEPPDALSDGGIGVGPIRKVAKQLKLDAGHVGLLTNLAIRLDLLRREVVGTEGRGRNARELMKWRVGPLAAQWSAEPATTRWRRLVFAWLNDRHFNDLEGLPERVHLAYFETDTLHRQLVVRELESLGLSHDESTPAGVNAKQFEDWMVWRRPTILSPEGVKGVVDALRALGLATEGNELALTASGRALLCGEELPVESDANAGASMVVQGDYSIVMFPGASVETQMLLDRVAELESDAGARLYRLTEVSLRGAMNGGLTPAEIEAHLASIAEAALPQAVSYLIADVGRRLQTAVVTGATTVIASSDPVLIAEAVRVKAAGLRAIGPYTAVSMVAPEKVRAALSAKGVHVTLEATVEDPRVVKKREKLASARAEQQRISMELMQRIMSSRHPEQRQHSRADDEFDGPDEASADAAHAGSPYRGFDELRRAAERLCGDR